MPDYRREREERIRREQELEHKRRRRAIRRNQQKALRTSKSYVAFLTMAVLVFGTFAGIYIQLQSGMTARLRTISSLESQLEDVRADNDALPELTAEQLYAYVKEQPDSRYIILKKKAII